jgi:hypothetical protein
MRSGSWTTEREKKFIWELRGTRKFTRLELLIAYRKTLDIRTEFDSIDYEEVAETADEEIRRLS